MKSSMNQSVLFAMRNPRCGLNVIGTDSPGLIIGHDVSPTNTPFGSTASVRRTSEALVVPALVSLRRGLPWLSLWAGSIRKIGDVNRRFSHQVRQENPRAAKAIAAVAISGQLLVQKVMTLSLLAVGAV